MKKAGKADAILGLIIPWITLILLVGISTYYCDSLWLRSVCIVVAIVNGSVTCRLAWRVLHSHRKD